MKYMCVHAGYFLSTGNLPKDVDGSSYCPVSASCEDSYSSAFTFSGCREASPLISNSGGGGGGGVPMRVLPRGSRASRAAAMERAPPPPPQHAVNNNQSLRTEFCSGDGGRDVSASDTDMRGVLLQLRKSLKQIEIFLVNKEKETHRLKKIKRDWKNVAIVMDRLFFILYLGIIIASLTLMFPRP